MMLHEGNTRQPQHCAWFKLALCVIQAGIMPGPKQGWVQQDARCEEMPSAMCCDGKDKRLLIAKTQNWQSRRNTVDTVWRAMGLNGGR
eukprot:1158359-Pelagomonas_calceolata.AAC.9